MYLFLSILDTLFMYLRSCDHIVIANLVLVDIYTFKVAITVLSPIFNAPGAMNSSTHPSG